MYSVTNGLQVGDIILLRGGAKHSAVIAAATGGHFSHVCLVVDHSQVVEAVSSGGVQFTSCLRVVVQSLSNIAVLRPTFLDEESLREAQSRILDLAMGHQSRGYSLLGATQALKKGGKQVEQGKFFCSQLVANIYRSIGYPLFDRPDHKVTPNDYIRSEKFNNVTSQAVSKIPEYFLSRISSYGNTLVPLDGDGTSASDTAIVFEEFLKKARRTFRAHHLPIPERLIDVIEIITRPESKSLRAKVDSKLVKAFDEVDVVGRLRQAKGPADVDDSEKVIEEISQFGQGFVDHELKACDALTKHTRNQLAKNSEYHSFFRHISKEFRLEYAARMADYHSFVAECCEEVLRNNQKIRQIFSGFSKEE